MFNREQRPGVEHVPETPKLNRNPKLNPNFETKTENRKPKPVNPNPYNPKKPNHTPHHLNPNPKLYTIDPPQLVIKP